MVINNITESSRLVVQQYQFKTVIIKNATKYKISEIELRRAEVEYDRIQFDHCCYKVRVCILILLAVLYFALIFYFTVQNFALWKLLCDCVATPLGLVLMNVLLGVRIN